MEYRRAAQTGESVRVEITRDEKGAITAVKALSGPAYLRPLALQAAMEGADDSWHGASRIQQLMPAQLRGQPSDKEVVTFPEAFHNGQVVHQIVGGGFYNDELTEAKRAVMEIEGDSPSARQRRERAMARFTELVNLATLRAIEPNMDKKWKLERATHELQEFRAAHRSDHDPDADSQEAELARQVESARREAYPSGHILLQKALN
jgi:hypothetical protein